MAADDENKNAKARPATAGEPRKLDRRDVLKGLSTLPALGLFGYAWQNDSAPTSRPGSRRSPRRRRRPPTCR